MSDHKQNGRPETGPRDFPPDLEEMRLMRKQVHRISTHRELARGTSEVMCSLLFSPNGFQTNVLGLFIDEAMEAIEELSKFITLYGEDAEKEQLAHVLNQCFTRLGVHSYGHRDS